MLIALAAVAAGWLATGGLTRSASSPAETAANAAGASVVPATVRPFAETPELQVGRGDDADDVAIHPAGYVIGTSKHDEGGLEVYNTKGRRLQWLHLGKTNNVDLRGGLVVTTNTDRGAIDVLSFKRGRLRLLRSLRVPFDPYGICLFRRTVFVTSHDEGLVEQYSLNGKRLRRLSGIETRAESCVADDTRKVLYVAEEEGGIWRFPADPGAGRSGTLIDAVGEHLDADVEGLALVKGHLIASSQGDSTFAVYRRDRFVGRFRVVGGAGIDSVTETDGLEASAKVNLLVVHDDENPGSRSSNYKLIRLSALFGRP